MKGQIHIAFHFNEKRLNILKDVIYNISTWEDETDIIVHTNKKSFNIETANVIEWPNLSHPFLLTCMPTFYIKDHFDESFDFFVYMEDDIRISKDSYAYWKRYQTPNLGFIRKTGDFLCDLSELPIYHNGFLVFKQLYKAFWINTKDQMKEYIDIFPHVFQNEIITNIEWSRERSAFGNSIGNVFIPIDELEYAFVEHVGYNINEMPAEHINFTKDELKINNYLSL